MIYESEERRDDEPAVVVIGSLEGAVLRAGLLFVRERLSSAEIILCAGDERLMVRLPEDALNLSDDAYAINQNLEVL